MSTTHLQRYLAALPDGVDSYPEHVQKASIHRFYLEEKRGLTAVREALPAPVRALLDEPLLPSAWIPEVHAHALFLAIADDRDWSEEQIYEDWLIYNRKLLDHRLYRALMRVASPEVVIRGAGYRWGAFHRGVELQVGKESGKMVARIHTPEHLMPRLLAVSYGAAFQAAAEMAGAKRVKVELIEHTPTLTVHSSSWD